MQHIIPDIELLMRNRFDVLNHIIWAKPSGRWNGCHKESLRAYFPATERILFAGHYLGPYRPKDDGYAVKCDDTKRHIMTPLIDYFRNARNALGITAKQIADATGKKHMTSHWFGVSQWQLPNEADYLNLQALFARVAQEKHQQQELETPHHQLVVEYQALSRQCADLLDEYKSLRRPFSVSAAVPYTDVWTHKPVQFYPGKHPCEKPADMLRQIIEASSRPGDVVADFFMGSGSTIKAATQLGRRAIGIEMDEGIYQQTLEQLSHLVK